MFGIAHQRLVRLLAALVAAILNCVFSGHISTPASFAYGLAFRCVSAHHSLDVAFLAGEIKQTAFNSTAPLNRDGHMKKSRKPSLERVSDMPVAREIA